MKNNTLLASTDILNLWEMPCLKCAALDADARRKARWEDLQRKHAEQWRQWLTGHLERRQTLDEARRRLADQARASGGLD